MARAETGRVALVTGAAQGLGAAIARALHAAGHRVALADLDPAKAQAVAEGLGDGALALALDVRDPASVGAAVAGCAAALGPVDILVNNAARTQARDFFAITAEEWDDVLAINLRALLFTAQAVAPGMIERGWGRIINLTSVAGQRGGPQVQGAHYAASKAGIVGMTRTMAHLFAPNGVTVNAIAPGPVLTEQTALAPPEKLAMVKAQIPAGRIGRAEEVGSLAVWLASEDAGFVTGATVDINGGLLMR
jgi:3-oxoacyl-[acyl-carrier protein] reductase